VFLAMAKGDSQAGKASLAFPDVFIGSKRFSVLRPIK
jgi:hypothetical protein